MILRNRALTSYTVAEAEVDVPAFEPGRASLADVYLPMMGFVSFDREPEQYLVACVLRPGNAPDKKGAVAILDRLLARRRPAFKDSRFRVRLDAGFAAPDVFDFLDEEPKLEYAVAMPKNKVLLRLKNNTYYS